MTFIKLTCIPEYSQNETLYARSTSIKLIQPVKNPKKDEKSYIEFDNGDGFSVAETAEEILAKMMLDTSDLNVSYLDAMKFCIENGATNFKEALIAATSGNREL